MVFWISRLAWLIRIGIVLIFLSVGAFSSWQNIKWTTYLTLESTYLDHLVRGRTDLSENQAAENRIAIVDLDESSLEVFGPWPWSRDLIAHLIQNIQKHQPVALGMDIVFPDTYGQVQDQKLIRELAQSGVVLGQAFDFAPLAQTPEVGLLTGSHQHHQSLIQWPRAQGYVANSESIVTALNHRTQQTQASPCVGHITPSPSTDGVIRHIAPYIDYRGQSYPGLVMAMLLCVRQVQLLEPLFVSQQGLWTIPWPKHVNSYTVIPAKDLLTNQVDTRLLKDRWVLIGSSALGVGDRVATPLSPVLPGVMVHAEILSYLLDRAIPQPQGAFINQLPFDVQLLEGSYQDWAWLAWLFSGILIAGAIFLNIRTHLMGASFFLACGAIIWGFVSAYIYWRNLHTAWILPWATVFMLLVIYTPCEWAITTARGRQVMKRLASYVSSDIMNQLLQEGGRNHLLPQRKNITVLFVDIANYTAISERLSPETLGVLTEQVLSELTTIVHDHAGTLDKYMGDALMAFWGAPVDQSNQADLALECAQQMIQRVAECSSHWIGLYDLTEPVNVHIGINSGEVVVGEFGSELRKTYTAIGDAVNIAARLQELAKVWQQPILVGQTTFEWVHHHELLCVTEVRLRGKHQAENIYSPTPFVMHESTTN